MRHPPLDWTVILLVLTPQKKRSVADGEKEDEGRRKEKEKKKKQSGQLGAQHLSSPHPVIDASDAPVKRREKRVKHQVAKHRAFMDVDVGV
jgi:hypothetical protein